METYDSNNYPITYSSKIFLENGITVSNGDSTRYYYRPGTGVYTLSDDQITVYPNPGKGKFVVSSSENIDGIEIFNSVGEMVLDDSKIGNQLKSFDLSHYSKGIYVIRINTGNNFFTKKLILQ